MANFFDTRPFVHKQKEKERLFLEQIRQAARWHFKKNPVFRSICEGQDFDAYGEFALESLPYLPVSLFKKFDLISVDKKQIRRILYSSSTSGNPSKIMIDEITSRLQVKVLANILSDFLGVTRKVLVVIDTKDAIAVRGGELSSRGTAIRGMFSCAKRVEFILNGNLDIDFNKLSKIVKSLAKGDEVLMFGFTWLIYSIFVKEQNNKNLKKILGGFAVNNTFLLHIGGWKKLQELAIDKEDFNRLAAQLTGIPKVRVIDFYGMTEQLGVVYPDCQYGYKHVPLYSEILIRDFSSLVSVGQGKSGLIQLISPITYSYPGISLLSDDIGKVIGVDDCKCGRKGKYFVFEKRSDFAEVKGCGDTLTI